MHGTKTRRDQQNSDIRLHSIPATSVTVFMKTILDPKSYIMTMVKRKKTNCDKTEIIDIDKSGN